MHVTVEFPSDLEAVIRQNISGDLNAYAREALAVQFYRDRTITHGQLQQLLGMKSLEADRVLKRHGGVDELTPDELAAQVQASSLIRGKHSGG